MGCNASVPKAGHDMPTEHTPVKKSLALHRTSTGMSRWSDAQQQQQQQQQQPAPSSDQSAGDAGDAGSASGGTEVVEDDVDVVVQRGACASPVVTETVADGVGGGNVVDSSWRDGGRLPPLSPSAACIVHDTLIPSCQPLESFEDLLASVSPKAQASRPRWSRGDADDMMPTRRSSTMSRLESFNTPPSRIPQPVRRRHSLAGRAVLQPTVSPSMPLAGLSPTPASRSSTPRATVPGKQPFARVAERGASVRQFHRHCASSPAL